MNNNFEIKKYVIVGLIIINTILIVLYSTIITNNNTKNIHTTNSSSVKITGMNYSNDQTKSKSIQKDSSKEKDTFTIDNHHTEIPYTHTQIKNVTFNPLELSKNIRDIYKFTDYTVTEVNQNNNKLKLVKELTSIKLMDGENILYTFDLESNIQHQAVWLTDNYVIYSFKKNIVDAGLVDFIELLDISKKERIPLIGTFMVPSGLNLMKKPIIFEDSLSAIFIDNNNELWKLEIIQNINR